VVLDSHISGSAATVLAITVLLVYVPFVAVTPSAVIFSHCCPR
jgi:hypothetical protein